MKRTVYLILFRGVGGKTQLPVQALREILTEAGFENVATTSTAATPSSAAGSIGKRLSLPSRSFAANFRLQQGHLRTDPVRVGRPDGRQSFFGASKMREKFDQWIGVLHTARNWNTVLKLAELGRAAER
jgi:hypothetical protein